MQGRRALLGKVVLKKSSVEPVNVGWVEGSLKERKTTIFFEL